MKHNQSISTIYEAEAYVIDTTDPNDLDALFKEVLQLACDKFERHFDAYMASCNDDGAEAFSSAWGIALERVDVVTSSNWRHSKGANHTAVIAPTKDTDGNYLPLTIEEKWGCLNDAIIAHGLLSSDYAHDIRALDDPVIDKAIGSYWEWLRNPNRLNFDGLAEIDQILL